MEEAYNRYRAMVAVSGTEPMDFQTFAVSGLLAHFLEFERRSKVYGTAVDNGRFGRFLGSVSATGGENYEEAWKHYLKSKGRQVRKQKTKQPSAPPVNRPREIRMPQPTDEPIQRYIRGQLTEAQLREIELARHYKYNVPQSWDVFVRLHGYDPLKRYGIE